MWACPFCGRTGQRSKEHVWPQWLRRYPAHEVFGQGYKGQRFTRAEQVMNLDPTGRYQEFVIPSRHVASYLPHVQVGVCRDCNSRWMSRLEIAAQDLLDPMIRGKPAQLGPEEQSLLATWASKCAYTYAAEWDLRNRPWSTEDYRDLMNMREPSQRALIWLGHSTANMAYVGQMVLPMFATPIGTPADTYADLPPTFASAYLAAHSVVFIAHWLPHPIIDSGKWEDLFDDQIRRGLSRIWPPTDVIDWPTADIPEGRLVHQAEFLERFSMAVALPTVGRTPAEIDAIVAQYASGAEPSALRAKWNP
jgi:hypothetical protein